MGIKEILQQAKSNKIAVGAFNILNYTSARAAIKVANELDTPIILQTSTTTVKKYGVDELGNMLNSLKKIAKNTVLIHLDHCREPEIAKQCLDHFWDSVMIDASHLSIEENIFITKSIVEYAHERNKQVEGELGIIAGVEDEISSDTEVAASYEESIRYIKESNVDIFAPAIGTAHGIYQGIPQINFNIVETLSGATETPIVVHGGTGLSKEIFQQLIRLGASKINVSTAIKDAYIQGLKRAVDTELNLKDPLKIDEIVEESLKDTIRHHLQVFNFQ